MKITVKPYEKRNGDIMVYINNDRGVSLGLSAETGYQSTKASNGQKKLWEAFCKATREYTSISETAADRDNHNEWSFTLHNGVTFAITDTHDVGGAYVAQNGLYVIRDGKVMERFFEVGA